MYHIRDKYSAEIVKIDKTPLSSDGSSARAKMAKENREQSRGDGIKTKGEVDEHKWGYVVCLGTVVTFIAAIGHVNSFGLIYNDFVLDTHSSSKSITTAHGVFAMMLAVGGLILNGISKYFSMRAGGLFGALLFITGSFMTIPVTNTNQLPFTFGILQGVGFGIMVPVCYSMINEYFVKKRTTVMSVCKAIQGIVQIAYPQAVKKILLEYGFRGTLLLLSGISLHTIVGMLVMLPKERSRISKARPNDDAQEKCELMIVSDTAKQSDGAIVEKTRNTLRQRCERFSIVDCLNLKLFEDTVYCNICLGQSFVNFSDLTFFILQPMLLFQNGFDKTEVAACISIAAGADVAGRCIMVVISSFVTVNTRLLFFVATVLTMVGRIVMLHMSGFARVAGVTASLGLLRAWLHIASPLVLANRVSKEDFPGAYSLFLLTAGLVNVACNPLIGVIKDMYDDYTPAFYGLVACCLPCVLLWPLEYFMTRRRLQT